MQPIQALDLLIPLLVEPRGLVAIARLDRVALQRIPSSSIVARASPTSGGPSCFAASKSATLTLMKLTPACANAVFDAVVKSDQRVPIPITRSASAAMRLAANVPVTPIAPSADGWSYGSEPLPACVSLSGMPVCSTKRRSASVASE